MGKKITIDAEAEVKEVKRNTTKDKYKSIINSDVVEWLIYMLGYTLVLLITSLLFHNFEVKNFLYGFLASIIISILNKLLKPILKVLTLPITILSYGLFYELTNVIILYLTMAILGRNNFYIGGFLAPLFIAGFISILNIIVSKSLVEPLNEKRKNK